MRAAVLGLVLMAGCAAQGTPAGPADPMQIVWVQAYGMEVAAEPTVTWHDDCRADDWGAGRERAVGGEGGCTTMEMFFDTGVADLQTADKVSDSAFALALSYWKGYLVGTSDPNGMEMDRAQRALRAAGL